MSQELFTTELYHSYLARNHIPTLLDLARKEELERSLCVVCRWKSSNLVEREKLTVPTIPSPPPFASNFQIPVLVHQLR